MCPQHEHIAEWVPIDTAIGIEATHEAADILIEVAIAALAWRKAERHRAEALRLMDDYLTAAPRLASLVRDLDAALSRLTEALSKVQE